MTRGPDTETRRSTGPVSLLGLANRTTNPLLRHGINTIEELIARSRQDLAYETRGLGEHGLNEIEAALERQGLSLANDHSHPYRQRPYRSAINHRKWQTPARREAQV